jgi:hypothetical protein
MIAPIVQSSRAATYVCLPAVLAVWPPRRRHHVLGRTLGTAATTVLTADDDVHLLLQAPHSLPSNEVIKLSFKKSILTSALYPEVDGDHLELGEFAKPRRPPSLRARTPCARAQDARSSASGIDKTLPTADPQKAPALSDIAGPKVAAQAVRGSLQIAMISSLTYTSGRRPRARTPPRGDRHLVTDVETIVRMTKSLSCGGRHSC